MAGAHDHGLDYDALSERAWREQDTLLTTAHGSCAHIVTDADRPLCGYRLTGVSPTPTSAYPRGWREDLAWCQTCLRKAYASVVSPDESVSEGDCVVVSTYGADCVYHTEECCKYPEQPEVVSRGELSSGWGECWFCRQEPRGVPE